MFHCFRLSKSSLSDQVLEMRLYVYLISICYFFFSEMIAALKRLECEPNFNDALKRASTKLNKAFPEADIRLLVDNSLQKNSEAMYTTLPNIMWFVSQKYLNACDD